jgi:hypothetical protein
MRSPERRGHVVVEGVEPEIDAGRFPVKRTAGDPVSVEADVFAGGREAICCVLKHRKAGAAEWTETPMQFFVNDRWRGEFRVPEPGRYQYTIEAWADPFKQWRLEMLRRIQSGTDDDAAYTRGAELAAAIAERAAPGDAPRLRECARVWRSSDSRAQKRILALDDDPAQAAARNADRDGATTYARELEITVEPAAARFSAWYEFFPALPVTAADCEKRLDYIARLGFDTACLAGLAGDAGLDLAPIGGAARRRNLDLALDVRDFEPERGGADAIRHWIRQGVKRFRIPRPQASPFGAWEDLIAEIRREDPEALFLSGAVARPKVMERLAKAGFSQSQTYFPWRNTKVELTEYLLELYELREYFRPSLWPNTPEVLPEYLQMGGRPAFAVRLALAATLGANYGVYGPAFELCEGTPKEPGSEEYPPGMEGRYGPGDRESPLGEFIAQINRIRRANPALADDASLRFHDIDNEQLICYSKETDDLSNVIVVVANLDPHRKQCGRLELPIETFGILPDRPYEMCELLTGERAIAVGRRRDVEIDPLAGPARIFHLRQRTRSERDFRDYA